MALIYAFGLSDTSFTGGPSNTGWQPQNFLYGSRITIPSAGTVTQLGVRADWGGNAANIDIKFGLYTTDGTLVAQSTGTITSGTAAWVDSGAISASVSAQDYIVLISAANSNASYYYNTSNAGSYATEAYATAMQSSETITLEGEPNLGYATRVDFTASGGPTFVPRRTLMGVG